MIALLRRYGATLIALLLIALGAWWFVANTEWYDDVQRTAPNGEAARDELYAAKALLRALGARVTAPSHLGRLPPPGATLLLTSGRWNLFAGRPDALRDWVAGGGHLVAPQRVVEADAIAGWAPVRVIARRAGGRGGADEEETSGGGAPASGSASASGSARASDSATPTSGGAPPTSGGAPAGDGANEPAAGEDAPLRAPAEQPGSLPANAASRPTPAATPDTKRDGRTAFDSAPDCHPVDEDGAARPRFGTHRRYAACAWALDTLQALATPEWVVRGARGAEAVSVAYGRGKVTATSLSPSLFGNDSLLHGDNAALFAALLDLRRGSEVWLVATETRPPLLHLLWERGAPAIVLAGLALLLALWRGAPRFGPPLVAPSLARRSMVEQIGGSAGFVARHGGAALHRAAVRALGTTARRRIAGFDAMTTAERASALAKGSGVDGAEIALALLPMRERPPRGLAQALTLIENTRRRLRDSTAGKA